MTTIKSTTFLRSTAAFVAAIGVAVTVSAPAMAKDTLVIAGYGGTFEAGMREKLIPEFEKQCECEISYVASLSAATVSKVVAEKDHPSLDVVIVDDGPQQRLVEMGLLAPLDPSIVTNLPDMYDMARLPGDIGVKLGVAALGLSYNTEAFAEEKLPPISSWADLGREDLKDRVTFPSISSTLGVAWLIEMAKINGGDENNVDPGFEAIKKIRNNTQFYEKSADLSPYYQQGTIVAGISSNFRIASLAATGFPVEFVFPKEGAISSVSTGSVVKGAPHPKLAQEFIKFMLEPGAQVVSAETVKFGPLNKTVTLPDDVAKTVIYGDDQISKLVSLNWTVVNKEISGWVDRWNKEIEAH